MVFLKRPSAHRCIAQITTTLSMLILPIISLRGQSRLSDSELEDDNSAEPWLWLYNMDTLLESKLFADER